MNRRIKKKKQKQLIERGWVMVVKMIRAYNKHEALSRDKMGEIND